MEGLVVVRRARSGSVSVSCRVLASGNDGRDFDCEVRGKNFEAVSRLVLADLPGTLL